MHSSVQATFAATLVDEWVRAGVAHAVVSPGSRSTPLALALAAADEEGRLTLHVRLDERSAGFFALGLGLATRRPAVVVTTSGTAAVELHPAVVESHQARVPLVACTADRPPELHHVGAPQTVEQAHLFAGAVRWSVEPGVARAEAATTWRSLASRMVAEAVAGPLGPGPVHANLTFVEPLTGSPGPLPPGRPGGRPWHRVEAAPLAPASDVVAELAGWAGRRGLVVAGAGAGGADPRAVGAMAGALGWPVLADPRSGLRLDRPGTVAAADALLRGPGWARSHRPDVVLRLGAPWASKVLGAWLAGSGAEQFVVDPDGSWPDPDRTAGTVVRADPGLLCRAVARRAGGGGGGGAPDARAERLGPAYGSIDVSASRPDRPAGLQEPAANPRPGRPSGAVPPVQAGPWLAGWIEAESTAQAALDAVLAAQPVPTEPALARALVRSLGPAATLVVASSMPVRDLEWFVPATPAPPRVLAN
ncbi:MAG: 2-succinyl-5-enolpyruvyl-6-hydroxy-3-cyclohexene-1-carboxylic-acid synthase, partial [Acidimicrobiales bacterium]